jgi:hypothetical protein
MMIKGQITPSRSYCGTAIKEGRFASAQAVLNRPSLNRRLAIFTQPVSTAQPLSPDLAARLTQAKSRGAKFAAP